MSDLPVNRKRATDEITSSSNSPPDHTPKRRPISPASQEALYVAPIFLTPHQNAPFRLLSIPPELRNRIDIHIVRGKTIAVPSCSVTSADLTASSSLSAFALTRTCRQIRLATSSLVFTSNTWLLTSFSLATFIAHVRPDRPFPPEQLAQIHTVMVNVTGHGCGMACRLVHQGRALFSELYPGLRKVVVMGSKEELEVFEKYVKVAGYEGWEYWKRSHEGEGVRFVKMAVDEFGGGFEV